MVEVFSADNRAGERVDGCDELLRSWNCGKVIDMDRTAGRETASNEVHRCMMGGFG